MQRKLNPLSWLRERWLESLLILGLAIMLVWFGRVAYGFLPEPPPTPTPEPPVGEFSGDRAYQHILEQVSFGPRPTGSEANLKTGDYIAAQLKQAGWLVEVEEFTYHGVLGRNIIGRAGKGPVAIIGAHYDTRRKADKDPDSTRRNEPVLGANDGASGTAVLLELARSLNQQKLKNEVWLTFFDAEDDGRLDGWDYSAGSTYMAENLSVTPQFVVVADMVGDADQQIYKEQNSTPELLDEIWSIAAGLGYSAYLIPEYKWSILDDHTPFLKLGIPAVDIIDFDYPPWHTTQDTADKVSPAALERVGRVLQAFLEK
jgi:Zn-dependent M28 family amino/carboxypeptidase